MKNIIIIGSSGHAKVIIDIIEKCGKFKIIGLVDSFRKIGETTFDYPILGSVVDIPRLIKEHDIKDVFIAVGSNWNRSILYNKISKATPQLKHPTLVHPDAVIGRNVTIGSGTVVMAGVIINPDSVIGDYCIVNTGSSIDHDCSMDNFSSLSPGVTLGGNVHIEKYCTIGLGAMIINKISVGEHTLIGAGSVLVKNIPSKKVAFGVPCEIIRDRAPDENIF